MKTAINHGNFKPLTLKLLLKGDLLQIGHYHKHQFADKKTLNLYPSDYFQAAVLDTNDNESFSLGHWQQHKVNKLQISNLLSSYTDRYNHSRMTMCLMSVLE